MIRKDAPLETAVQAAHIKALRAQGWYVRKHPMSMGGHVGTVDLYGCAEGHFFAIEVKREGYSPSDVTRLQRDCLDSVKTAGGLSFVSSDAPSAVSLIREWISDKPR